MVRSATLKGMGILDFIFPKYCVNCKKLGSYLCANCLTFISFDTEEICVVCNRPAINGLTHPGCLGKHTINGVFSAIAYKGAAKKLIYNFKYKPYLADLKNVLVDLFYENLIQKEEFYSVCKNNKSLIFLVPIPLHSSKLRSRGYNQAEILAAALSKKLGFPTANLLKRLKKTPSLAGLTQKIRKANIKGAFEVEKDKKEILKNAIIFLVDDIFTTGATLNEAAKMLKKSGAKKVYGLALARD
ncbi:MAG: ComF family protein [Candidatus Levybacteria bacterium]|nr:ComF family protein [Candidatus Levybacteria bacterium]